MIIMGIDFGDVRTGLAACDRNELLAHGEGTVVANGFKKTLAEVINATRRINPELIVVGNPLNMDGSEGPRSQKCKDFAKALEEATGIKTVMHDERLTSVSAHDILESSNIRAKKHKKYVDELSARIILDDFLNFRKMQKKSKE